MPGIRIAKFLRHDVSRLVAGSAFIFGCRIFGAIGAFLAQLFLARWMGASELGLYVLAHSWLATLSFLAVGGYGAAAMRFIGKGMADTDHGYVRAYVRHSTLIVMAASLAVTVIGIVVVRSIDSLSSDKQALFEIALVGVPFFAAIKLDVGLANSFGRFSLAFMPNNVVRPTLFLAAIVLFWYLDFSLDALFATLVHTLIIASLAVPVVVYLRVSTRNRLNKSDLRYERRLWDRTALELMMFGLFTNYFYEITVITIGFLLPSAEVGIFNAGNRVAMLINFGLFAIDAFITPAMSRHLSKGERVELVRVVRQSTLLRFSGALAAVLFLIVFGKNILALFGEEFVRGYMVLILLALSQLVRAAIGPAVRLLSISGHQNKGLFASIFSLALWMALAIILVPRFGINGAGAATVLALSAWCAALRYQVMRHLEIDTLIFVRDLQRK